jgi:DNA invertase Pin-like site-specific DNA recombinase
VKAAIYARVSTLDPRAREPASRTPPIRRAREWASTEFVVRGVSGAKDSGGPALDALLKDAKRRRFRRMVCWRLESPGSQP